MIQIPPPTKVRYDALLAQHHIPEKFHPDYLKWLRYYLDFCRKYNFKEAEKKSLPNFIKKLKAKKQTDQQQNQAINAISILLEIEPSNKDKTAPYKIQQDTKPYHKEKRQITNASWVSVYNDLKAEINIRHYSPSTLKTYTGWARQLQNFTRSKDPQLLVDSDVKDFLTYLAVDRKVAASTQNQAFNALLFLFRQDHHDLYSYYQKHDHQRSQEPSRFLESSSVSLAALNPVHSRSWINSFYRLWGRATAIY